MASRQVDNLTFERDVGFQVDTLTTMTTATAASSRPDSGVSVSVSPMNQPESTESEVIFTEHRTSEQTRVRTSSSSETSEAEFPKPASKKRRPKRAKKSETRRILAPMSDSKGLLQQELDSELADLLSKISTLEKKVEDENSKIDDLVSLCMFMKTNFTKVLKEFVKCLEKSFSKWFWELCQLYHLWPLFCLVSVLVETTYNFTTQKLQNKSP